ncbi:hypothetical protein [Mesorhizobium sp.]|uniref:hypothetical protein n=1 Tax=Mesorhizobium sp. TaxID=1871066 RepID=UPI0025F41D74|nr:hypothetical protein [Mesorhizobium sp.]
MTSSPIALNMVQERSHGDCTPKTCSAAGPAIMKPAIAMKAQSRKRAAESRPAGRAPILIEMISATRAPPSRS